ncbi:MAG: hypothetical protein E6094_05520 [Clostridium perfringens]|nr:hypothetical protein [Clostridium perfringens]
MGIFDFLKKKYKTLITKENTNKMFNEKLTTNPKFNRSKKEKDLFFNFCCEYNKKIDSYENSFYNAKSKIKKIENIDLRIKQYELSIKILNEFKEFCFSKGKGGELYFEDMWEHCHNINNPDFKFIDKLYKELEDLKNNKDFYTKNYEIIEFKKTIDKELIDIISKNQGILQKDVYKNFEPHFKDSIQSALYSLDKNQKIIREKFKNTYKLYTVNI